MGFAEELLDCLKANVNESLALDTFCLAVGEMTTGKARSARRKR